jgi:hypothetical protein
MTDDVTVAERLSPAVRPEEGNTEQGAKAGASLGQPLLA